MSLFSSLNYLLTRAASAIHQNISTDQFSNLMLDYSQKSGNNSNGLSIQTLLSNLSGPPILTKAYIENNYTNFSESDEQFHNETYPNADYLLESWWNIFDERYLRHGWGWTITLIIAYLIILVVGVIGNVMVILVVLLRPQMRSVTNMFIMNLAVADLFVIVFCVPSTLLANIIAPWILGTFMCKAVAYIQGVSVCASAYSLAAISFDRCQAVYRNYERPRGFSQRICVATVFLIWAAAVTLTIPWAAIFEVKISEYDGLSYCVEIWKVETHGNIYFLVVTLLCFYAIPLVLIFVSNWIIYCHVSHRRVPEDSSQSSAPIRKMHRQTKHDVLKMLGIVTLTFLFSWLPLYILVIVIKFSDNISETAYDILGILMPIAQWLGSWNSSINPILYAFLNKKFRRMFISILPSCFRFKSAGKHMGSQKTNSYTTTYTGKGGSRNKNTSRSDFYRRHRIERSNSHHPSMISTFYENTGKVSTKTAKYISSDSTSATQVINSGSPDKIFERTATGTITHL